MKFPSQACAVLKWRHVCDEHVRVLVCMSEVSDFGWLSGSLLFGTKAKPDTIRSPGTSHETFSRPPTTKTGPTRDTQNPNTGHGKSKQAARQNRTRRNNADSEFEHPCVFWSLRTNFKIICKTRQPLPVQETHSFFCSCLASSRVLSSGFPLRSKACAHFLITTFVRPRQLRFCLLQTAFQLQKKLATWLVTCMRTTHVVTSWSQLHGHPSTCTTIHVLHFHLTMPTALTQMFIWAQPRP